jgi:lipopolysaccharide biosynthesis glycosyltransferase
MSGTLSVVTLADEAFALPLAVLVRSMLDHLSGPGVHLTIIDGGIIPRTRERLMSSWKDPRLTVEWRNPGLGGIDLPVTGRIPALTFARLTLPALLPAECERAIIMDADQLVLTDLLRLGDEPFGDASALAPRDPFIPSVSSPNGLTDYAALGLHRDAPYFSGALMVVNVAAWRRDRVSERALVYVKDHASELGAYDQDALNAVLARRIRELDARWQVQPRILGLRPEVTPHLDATARRQLADDPWVVHFSGRLKPWLYEGLGKFDALFREVLKRTAFHDYRPPRGARALAYQLYDGPIRHWVYPLEIQIDAWLRRLRRRSVKLAVDS